jgi:hypothetical protein
VTVRRAVRRREIRVTRRKARATHKVAKGRAKRVEASKLSSAYTAVLDFVAETRILCGYEKTFPRFGLRGIHLGLRLCGRLLLG